MNPSIDIIVPTYNRPIDLKKFIEEIQKQTYSNFKVWIIDDHGKDFIKDLIPDTEKFVYIRLPENRGQAYARNIPLASGTSEIVISMDDDAWFDSDSEALQKIIEYFSTYPDIGCLMFNVATPLSDYDTNQNRGRELPLHVTCGCAYKRNVLELIGGFSGFLHSMAEETDISLKIITTNHKIRFAPDIKLFHDFNPQTRSRKWYRSVRHNTARNDLLIVVMRYPIKLIPFYWIGKFASHIYFDLKNKRVLLALSLIFSVFYGFMLRLPQAIKLRKPISSEKFEYWHKLLKQNHK